MPLIFGAEGRRSNAFASRGELPPHSAISGTGRRLAVLAVRAGTGLKFPKRVQLSPAGMAVGWYEDEVSAWILSRVRQGGKRPPIQYRGKPTRQIVDVDVAEAARRSDRG